MTPLVKRIVLDLSIGLLLLCLAELVWDDIRLRHICTFAPYVCYQQLEGPSQQPQPPGPRPK